MSQNGLITYISAHKILLAFVLFNICLKVTKKKKQLRDFKRFICKLKKNVFIRLK